MENRFLTLISIVLKNENGATAAGYVNDPYDLGGETICGITRRDHPTLSVWGSLDRLPVFQKKSYKPIPREMTEINQVYRASYYDKVKADQINDPELALQVFDCAVNCGVARASKMLQSVVGCQQDGIIGPKTLGKCNGGHYLASYKAARCSYYRQIATKGNNRRYLNGWLNRVNNTHL